MARFTVRDFAKSLGLSLEGADYIGAGVMLTVLTVKGIAKEVDRINTSARGRKSVVYEVPDQFLMTLSAPVTEVVVPEKIEVEEVVDEVENEVTEEVVEETVDEVEEVEDEVDEVEETFCYDDDEDEDEVNEAA